MSIHYSFGGKYKWRLDEDVSYFVEINEEFHTNYYHLNYEWLTVQAGYCWDGASGPAIDTANFMRGSLFHDVLYQAMREGQLDRKYRKKADQILRKICLEDGMSRIRAWWVYSAVRIGARQSAISVRRDE